jgi:hypothetical protein
MVNGDRRHPSSRGEDTVAERPHGKAAATSTPPHSEVRLSEGRSSGREEPSTPQSRGGRSLGSLGSLGPTSAALAEVMQAEETTRLHGFATVLAPVTLGTAAALPVLGGDPTAKLICGIALVLTGLASLAMAHLTRASKERVAPFPRTVIRIYCTLLCCTVVLVEYYTGPFSPVPVVLTFGVFHFGQSTDRYLWLYLATFIIASYTALASFTAFGIIEDRGLFNAVSADLGARIFAIIAAASVLGVTLRLARVARAALREAIERSNEALIMAQRREAQLAEAHHQLDRALQLAVGKPGRYTGSHAGDFQLGLVIGIGAIGEVYSAVRASDGLEVAVKLLQTNALQRSDLVERILREGMITSSLDSPYLVRVYEVGRMFDGAPFITMERLQGRDLGARLRQDGLLPLDQVTRLAEHLGTGLQHAHDAEIIHRDLKPLNIFEAESPEGSIWKILDFGISKLTSSSGTLTQEGVVGTPGYMSPEQARGLVIDQRSDVFSMAVVLYRALTGQPAFPGESTPQVMFDVVYKVPRQPTSVVRGIPSDVDWVMAIGMAKDPAERFQSASELAAAFALATRRGLSVELRARGQALVRKAPWGSMLAPQRADDPQTSV